jgi:branched-chain amino acid transport system ATP-binding protein
VTIVMVEHVMPVIMRLAARIVVINFGEKSA